MRRILFLLFFTAALATNTFAQSTSPITCLDETIYDEQARIVLPEISEESPNEFRITAISNEQIFPVVAVTNPEGDTFCDADDNTARFYGVDWDDQSSGEAFAGAQEVAFDPGLNMVQLGAIDDQTGQFFVIVEGEFFADDPRDHNYVFSSNAAVSTPEALLFALESDVTEVSHEPALEIMPSGEAAEALPPVEAQLITDIEVSEQAVGAEILQETSLNVPYVEGGRYALVLIFNTGSPTPPVATVTESEMGTLALTCDDELLAENALEFMLPDDGVVYTVTALGVDDVDPVLAVVDEQGNGICETDSLAAEAYGVNLPNIQASGNEGSALVEVSADRRVIVADQTGLGGEFVLLVEGASASAEGQIFSVRATPGMISAGSSLGLFAIALTTELDPLLALNDETSALFGEEEAIVCEGSGERATCYGEPPRLNDYNLTLADGDILRGYELDPLLRLPLSDVPENIGLPFGVYAQQQTSGDYVLVVHLVTD